MVQGDKYSIAFDIKQNGTAITDANCDGVKIQIGKVLKIATYNSSIGKWTYPITQAESLALPTNAIAQVQVKIGSSIFNSGTISMKVKESIIKEVWTNGSNV